MDILRTLNFTSWLPTTSNASVTLILQTTIISLVVMVIWSVAMAIKRRIMWHRVFSNLPGPPEKHWMYGSFVNFPKNGHDRLERFISWVNTHSKKTGYVRIWAQFGKPFIMVCHPSTMKRILKTAVRELINASIDVVHAILRPAFEGCALDDISDQIRFISTEPKPVVFGSGYKMLMPWLGDGLLIAGGGKWARNRRLLTPAFHFDILKPYMNVYNSSADVLVSNIDKFAQKGERFEAFQYICMSSLDIILRCAFSYEIDVQRSGQTHPYVTAVNQLATTVSDRNKKPWLLFDKIFYLTSMGKQFKKDCDYVHGVAEDIIDKRQKTLLNAETIYFFEGLSLDRKAEGGGQSGRKYLDFLDILLTAKDESGKGLSKIDIRNEVDTFLFEGHDTTASAISWILYSLAEHPEYQRKCQEEIDGLLEGRETDDLEWADLSKVEYLTMCIKEGMRLHCPVAIVGRQTTKDFDIGDTILPAGTGIQINIWGLHHNEDVWENHMEFIPDRFSKENAAKMDNYQFVPFAAGPRNCIGQHFALNEEKVVLSKLLHNFSFKLDPNHVVRRRLAAVMRAENGIYMYAERRSH